MAWPSRTLPEIAQHLQLASQRSPGPHGHHRQECREGPEDLRENASVLALLANYPERINVLAASLPYTRVIKRAASLPALGIPLATVGLQLVRRRQLQAGSRA
jgi:hypothetical protein